MWKTNMVRFRPLILHDITWYNMGLPHKMEPQTPMSYHNSLKQQVRGALHTETNMAIIGGMVIHPIMGIFIYIHRIFTGLITSPHLGEKNNGTCRRSGSTPLHGTRQISATAAYLWTHLGRTEAPTTCGHIMALLSYLPLSQWEAPGTMFHGKVPWRKSTIINDQTWDLTNNENRMGAVYGMPFTAGYYVGNGRDGPQSIGGTLRKPHCTEFPRIMGYTPEALGPQSLNLSMSWTIEGTAANHDNQVEPSWVEGLMGMFHIYIIIYIYISLWLAHSMAARFRPSQLTMSNTLVS